MVQMTNIRPQKLANPVQCWRDWVQKALMLKKWVSGKQKQPPKKQSPDWVLCGPQIPITEMNSSNICAMVCKERTEYH